MKTPHRECSVNRLSVARSTQDSEPRATVLNECGTRLTTYSTVPYILPVTLHCASLEYMFTV